MRQNREKGTLLFFTSQVTKGTKQTKEVENLLKVKCIALSRREMYIGKTEEKREEKKKKGMTETKAGRAGRGEEGGGF